MNRDQKALYALSLLIPAVLLVVLLIHVDNSRVLTAILMLPLTVAVCLVIRKRRSLSIHKREVLLLTAVVAVLYVVLTEMTGLYFEFHKNPYFGNLTILLTFFLPSLAIIVMTEMIRSVLLAQNQKPVSALAFVSCVLAEILMFSNVAGITGFNRFMDLVALTLFPALSANIYYHYVSKRYGMLPNIAFRIITTLYVYFVPTVTGMSDSIASCIKIVCPIILLALTAALFETKKKNAVKKGQKLGVLGTGLTVCVILAVAMLISCQFRFGALVIATESMTGEINKGDMIVYERYDGQPIEEGQVIVFLQNESRIVHRVVRIESINGEVRYYTKGDANEDMDRDYRVASDIVGLTDMKVSLIGYPTLWLHEIFSN